MVLGDDFGKLCVTSWTQGPQWVLGHCSPWELSSQVPSRLFLSLVGERHGTWQRVLLQQRICVVMMHRQNLVQLHTHLHGITIEDTLVSLILDMLYYFAVLWPSG